MPPSAIFPGTEVKFCPAAAGLCLMEAEMMLEQRFQDVYTKFKLHFYREIFDRFQSREASLTKVESFCMEVIQALRLPTINKFASFT